MRHLTKWLLYAWLLTMSALFAFVLLSCAGNGQYPPLPPGEPVDHSDYCTEISWCRRYAPFYRQTDAVIGPVWWAVSVTGRGCQVPAEVFTLLRDGQVLRCDWRSPRPTF